MKWLDITKVRSKGFAGAEKTFRSQSNFATLARWNHSQAVGWYLYLRWPSASKLRFYRHAGGDSISWTEEQAQSWADNIIKAEFQTAITN